MIASKLFRASPEALQSKAQDIVGNADSNLGDVVLISSDRKYFLAHRTVLVCYCSLIVIIREFREYFEDIKWKKWIKFDFFCSKY